MIKPLGDRVVLKVHNSDNKTNSGIYIPKAESSNQAEIVAVGPGRILETGENVPLEVKVGDQVIFSKFAGTKVEVDGKEYLVVHEGDIIAVI